MRVVNWDFQVLDHRNKYSFIGGSNSLNGLKEKEVLIRLLTM